MIRLRLMCAFFLFSCLSHAYAQSNASLVSKKALAKCYVELLGGKRVIYKLTVDNEELIPALVTRLPGTEIRAPGVTGKVKIYKAFQCLQNEADFQYGRARVLEKRQVN